MNKTEQAETCPYGCGRMVLPSRLADHFLFARTDHLLAHAARTTFEDAYKAVVNDIEQEIDEYGADTETGEIVVARSRVGWS